MRHAYTMKLVKIAILIIFALENKLEDDSILESGKIKLYLNF